MTKEWTCQFCGGKATWFDKKTLTYLPDSKTRCSRCGRTDERKELILSEANGDNLDIMVRNLDGLRIGRMGINKCTAANDVWLTVYDAVENGKGFGDEQLSFRPAELLAFCREVFRVANMQISNNNVKGGRVKTKTLTEACKKAVRWLPITSCYQCDLRDVQRCRCWAMELSNRHPAKGIPKWCPLPKNVNEEG